MPAPPLESGRSATMKRQANAVNRKASGRRRNQELYIGLVPAQFPHDAQARDRSSAAWCSTCRHGMDRRGWLRTNWQVVEGRRRKTYEATAAGRRALQLARERVRELYEEMWKEGR